MAFSLSNWFKGKSVGTAAPPPAPTSAPAPLTPPAPTKLVKSGRPAPAPVARAVPSVRKVVPNSVQPVSLRDPSSRGPVPLPVGAPPPGVVGPVRPPATSLTPARKISLGNPAAVAALNPVAPELAAPAAAPEPASQPASVPEVTVTLLVEDFIDRLPPTLLAGGAVDRQRAVEFRSSELYSDLTKGRASVPASVIYARCPELFSRPVSETEDAEVSLPLAKLVEQLTPALQTRADQVAEENVGEIETPFLQVAMEDGARLPTAAGTSAGAVRPPTPLPMVTPPVVIPPTRPPHRTGQIQTISAPKLSPAEPVALPAAPTAASVAPINQGKRPPSTVRASVAGGKIRLSGPTVPNRISLTPGPTMPPPPAVPPVLTHDLPPSATQSIASPMPPLPPSAASPSHQVAKKTARIQIPPISLRSPVAPGNPSPARPMAVPPPSVPIQPSPVTVRQNNGGAEMPSPVMFHAAPPPPPPSVKPMPPSFAPPTSRPAFAPPSFPAVPPPADAPAPAPVPTPAPVADDRQITLGLAAVLRGLSSSLLAVEPSSVPDDVTLTLPFALVEGQLSTGRVSVPRATFQDALPAGHKEVLDAGADFAEVPLPLQEVFQNLPSDALTMRADQVEEQVSQMYATPFSQKAEEDAQRLGVGEVPPAAPLAAVAAPAVAPVLPTDRPLPPDEPLAEEKPAAASPAPVMPEGAPAAPVRDIPLDLEPEAPTPAVEAKAEVPAPVVPVEEAPESNVSEPAEEPAPAKVEAEAVSEEASTARKLPVAAKGKDSELQVLFMTEDELDAKTVVRLVSQMPGIDGCAIMFGDGLRLAGNFPDENKVEGFSAMAPPFFKRAKNFALESGLGKLQAFSLHTESGPCSFLMHEDICLGVRHTNRGFMPGVREKLEVVVRELARMYS